MGRETKEAAVRIWADGVRSAVIGALTVEDGRYTLSYAEPGLDGCPTNVAFDGRSVRIERSGAYQTVLRFSAGQTADGDYATPFGRLRLSIRTERLSCVETANGWRIDLVYACRWAGGMWEQHELSISIAM